MPDYKEMYIKLFRASEKAVNILIAAQQECEELYVNHVELELKAVPLSPKKRKARMRNDSKSTL